MCDTNSTHVARTYFNLLGGCVQQSSHKGKPSETWLPSPPSEFVKELKKLNEEIEKYNRTQMTELIGSAYGSPCFATLLKILNKRKRKLFNNLCEKIFTCCRNNETEEE